MRRTGVREGQGGGVAAITTGAGSVWFTVKSAGVGMSEGAGTALVAEAAGRPGSSFTGPAATQQAQGSRSQGPSQQNGPQQLEPPASAAPATASAAQMTMMRRGLGFMMDVR
jgi:hypothetical protein